MNESFLVLILLGMWKDLVIILVCRIWKHNWNEESYELFQVEVPNGGFYGWRRSAFKRRWRTTIVEGDNEQSKREAVKMLEKDRLNCKRLLVERIADSHIGIVEEKTTPKAIWDCLF